MTPLRTLPIRIAPLPGEALDSWLDALAYRMHMPVGDLLRSVGLNAAPEEGDQGMPCGRLDGRSSSRMRQPRSRRSPGPRTAQVLSMTLAAYDGRALIIDPELARSTVAALGTQRRLAVLPSLPRREQRALEPRVAPGVVIRMPAPSSAC